MDRGDFEEFWKWQSSLPDEYRVSEDLLQNYQGDGSPD
jgi:hypothetical protein